ncbi:unnamed protein product [Moneuplotes crassus]|uniref:Uncharacterized protein n=2 Tax=Euplotes crassus TaxID=5936 RepID=A0AAD1XNF1_EUPCR|nr:unnamed protein product [Moneuplotes crassus]
MAASPLTSLNQYYQVCAGHSQHCMLLWFIDQRQSITYDLSQFLSKTIYGKKYPNYMINDLMFDLNDGEVLYSITTHFRADVEGQQADPEDYIFILSVWDWQKFGLLASTRIQHDDPDGKIQNIRFLIEKKAHYQNDSFNDTFDYTTESGIYQDEYISHPGYDTVNEGNHTKGCITNLPKVFMVDSENNAAIYVIKYDEMSKAGSIKIHLAVDVGSLDLDSLVEIKLYTYQDDDEESGSYANPRGSQIDLEQSNRISSLVILQNQGRAGHETSRVDIYSIYKEFYQSSYHNTLQKIKSVRLKVQAIDIDVCPKNRNMSILGINGDILHLSLSGEFITVQKATGNPSYETKVVPRGERSIFAFTTLNIGTNYAFVGREAGEVLVFDLRDFSLKTTISNLGSYKGGACSVEKVLVTENDNFCAYILQDNTKGVLRVSNETKNAKLIAQSDCILANQGISKIKSFHFFHPEKIESKDINEDYMFLTVNDIGTTTVFSNSLKVQEFQVFSGLSSVSSKSGMPNDTVTATQFLQSDVGTAPSYLYLGTENGVLIKFSIEYERREYSFRLSENEIHQVEVVRGAAPIVIVGMYQNEEDDFLKILLYREEKNTLKVMHCIDNYKISAFKIYKAIAESYTIILKEEDEFYQYNLAYLMQENINNESIDSDVNSIALDDLVDIWNQKTLHEKAHVIRVYKHSSGKIYSELFLTKEEENKNLTLSEKEINDISEQVFKKAREDSLIIFELVKEEFLNQSDISDLKILQLSFIEHVTGKKLIPEIKELGGAHDLSSIIRSSEESESDEPISQELTFSTPERKDPVEEAKITIGQPREVRFYLEQSSNASQYIESSEPEGANLPLRVKSTDFKMKTPQKNTEQAVGVSYLSSPEHDSQRNSLVQGSTNKAFVHTYQTDKLSLGKTVYDNRPYVMKSSAYEDILNSHLQGLGDLEYSNDTI